MKKTHIEYLGTKKHLGGHCTSEMGGGKEGGCMWLFKLSIQQEALEHELVKFVKAFTLIVEETTYLDSIRNWMRL